MVTIDYILIGVAILLAILDVVMSVIHLKPQSNVETIDLNESVDTLSSNINNTEISTLNDDTTLNNDIGEKS